MKNAIYLLSVVILLFLAYRLAGDLNATNTHPGDGSCNDCHLARGKIDQTNADILIASQEVLCKTCHENALTASHPSGFKPDRGLPKAFPLDWKAELTCSSCHSVHGSKPGLLRVDRRGKALCFSCHDKGFFSGMKDAGSSLISFGHLDARASLGGGIDQYSIQCLSCHDTLEGDLNVQLRGGIVSHNSSKASHPIGMKYETSISFGGYRPVTALPKKIALPNGMVSCISCHEGYSEIHGKLVMANRGSALCFSCHDL